MVGIVALKDTSLFGGLKTGEFKAHITKNQRDQARTKPEVVLFTDSKMYNAIYEAVKGLKPENIENKEK